MSSSKNARKKRRQARRKRIEKERQKYEVWNILKTPTHELKHRRVLTGQWFP